VGVHPPPSPARPGFSIMKGCTPEIGNRQSVWEIGCLKGYVHRKGVGVRKGQKVGEGNGGRGLGRAGASGPMRAPGTTVSSVADPDPGRGKNQDPDPGSRMTNPGSFF
jgi:hypothetical protein